MGNSCSIRTIAYGPLPDQVGDLYTPDRANAPMICLLHGGFWRVPYGRDNIAPIAMDLMERGFAVWNLEYRRVGSGGGWPCTLQDVGEGIDHLATLAAQGASIDLKSVTVIGHSAGGHLALWSAQRDPRRGNGYEPKRVRINAAVGLAPVADLALAYELRCGNGAVEDLLGGSPGEWPTRYRTTSPAQMLPLNVKQLIIHGTNDADVPIDISRRYAEAAQAAGDDIRFIELPGASHMDFVDPHAHAHATLCRWLSLQNRTATIAGVQRFRA
jgi:acetyl esterase/lipase